MRFAPSAVRHALGAVLVLSLVAAACGDDSSDGSNDGARGNGGAAGPDEDAGFDGPLNIGAIPDQDPELLARNYGLVADYLSDELGIDVRFERVTDYDGAVTAFRVGDLHLVWFGGLTGVQARLQVPGAEAIAQRDIDAEFTSVFIAHARSGIEPFDDVAGLTALAGHTFTFGSESSTSGRLMPQHFLGEAGVSLDDFRGQPGFSGSHDTTIALVEAGTYEAGVLNSQVWHARVDEESVDTSNVRVVFETPPYYDYHWVARPELGDDLTQQIVDALKGLDPSDPDHAEILEFFGAESFIETDDSKYAEIEAVAREIGMIEE